MDNDLWSSAIFRGVRLRRRPGSWTKRPVWQPGPWA
ncbi:MAG: hypothetical protein LBD04_02235 [Synergistaceae bacterium]|nr:hypothetical protein [Synergistaceae bacterium]